MSKIDLTGRRFGKLTVIGFSHRDKYVFWKCKCDCGNNTIVMTGSLVSGQTKSCGCLRKTCYRKNRNTFTVIVVPLGIICILDAIILIVKIIRIMVVEE